MLRSPPSPLTRWFACCLLLLSAMAPTRAQTLPGPIEPLWYATTVDLAAATATFAIRFDRAPDFISTNAAGVQDDAFQIWTDTASTNPFESTYRGILGTGPLGTQMMVTPRNLPISNQLAYVWPQLLSDPGPKDPGGWGSVEALAGYTLSSDHMLSFDVPLALLRAADGHFNYVFQTYRTGAWGETNYFGVSGEAYSLPCVPEPAQSAALGAGILLLAAASRRGRRRK